MRQRHALTSTVIFLLALCLPARPASAQDEEPSSDDEVVERILELRREIDELMARLPPPLREQVRRRLAEEPQERVEPAPEPPPPVVEAAPPPERPRFRRRRPVCNTLDAFDSNHDGRVNAMDRYWRHLYLWVDRDRDGRMDKREIESTFDQKVREIASDLDTFASAKSGLGEIRIAEHVLLDLRGNGFDPERSRDDAVLLVDADALKRGTGPTLLDASGREIEGVRPFERGWRLRDSTGEVTRLSCP